ncbi:MAG TPA: alpha/beta hydrolase [Myxococcales bacterium]|nr:alpha/beta hydrolase [Myxococcales bacterium]
MRLAVSLLLAAACSQTEARPDSRIALSPCRIKGSGLQAQCGSLRVPEDRAAPSGRQIDLHVAIVPALARAPAADALFLLAGGPGQGASEAMGVLLGAFERIHRTRDLVLVDQRGTGLSHALRCDLHDAGATLAERLSGDAALSEQRFRKCLQGYDADPRLYTTSIAMQDLDDVRAALGYERIDLWGGSYGTRAALTYLREHGGHVRAVVLDGVAPREQVLPVTFARDAQRSMDLLLDNCASDAACAKAFPGLRARFEKLLADLGRAPAHATVQDPLTGAPAEVSIGRDVFASGLRGVLYQQDLASLVPLIVDRAARGDFAPFVASTAGLDSGYSRTMSFGLTFSVLCAEDLPFTSRAEIVERSKGTFLGAHDALAFADICSFWPRGAPPDRSPVKSDKPVLLLSGEIDPATPPQWAEIARRTLPNSLHLVVPGVGHGASAEGCVPQLMAKFVETADVKAVDAKCLQPLQRPPFFVSFAGPMP